MQSLGNYKKTKHTAQFLSGHFVSFQEQYMMTSDSMIIQTSTFWKIRGCGMKNGDAITHVHQKLRYPKCDKDNYVLIIVLLKDLDDCLVLLG